MSKANDWIERAEDAYNVLCNQGQEAIKVLYTMAEGTMQAIEETLRGTSKGGEHNES